MRIASITKLSAVVQALVLILTDVWRFPVVLEEFCIRKNSGGNGKHHGGNGVIRKIRFLDSMTVSILSSHRLKPGFGLHGGLAGSTGHNSILRYNGDVVAPKLTCKQAIA